MGLITILKTNVDAFKKAFKEEMEKGMEQQNSAEEVERARSERQERNSLEDDYVENSDDISKVWVEEVGPFKAKIIKILCEVADIGLPEAKKLVDNAPFYIEVYSKEAEDINMLFEAEGARTRIEECNMEEE